MFGQTNENFPCPVSALLKIQVPTSPRRPYRRLPCLFAQLEPSLGYESFPHPLSQFIGAHLVIMDDRGLINCLRRSAAAA